MKQFTVGIDLGTSNTVVAYAASGSQDIRLFEIEQLVGAGQVKAVPLLPSLRFHAAPGELPTGELQLPWATNATGAEIVGGLFARKLGAQVPGRLVTSAKSWLSHAAVDRMAPILPWGAGADVLKVSPVEASASYLAHVRAAWNWQFPDALLENQDIVLTVPASFDEGARALTVKAAMQAGLSDFRLLEEPQAALYDWLFRHRDNLASELADARLILVCDVGGGTTDLSLIRVDLHNGQPTLTRIGVGRHLMLGGDNMDLVLAHEVELRMAPGGHDDSARPARRLSATELSQLLERCRSAKEQLLGADAPERTVVTLLGTGAKMIGGTRSLELTRDAVERAVVDGFFPMVEVDETVRLRRSGLVEFGLPYASDPAITRHLAGFLQQHAAAARDALAEGMSADDPESAAIPDTLLLNGGVFHAPALAGRLKDTLDAWRGKPLRLLHNENPDVAVARGAVAYALARAGLAPTIGGGSARSYFLVLEDRRAHAASAGSSIEAICILPRGSAVGTEILLTERTFALQLGRPVRFHLVSSTDDKGGHTPHIGEMLQLESDDVVRLPPIATVLRESAKEGKREVPVRLATSLTEVGTLEMHCVSTADANERWLLEFQLRSEAQDSSQDAHDANAHPLPSRYAAAIEKIERIFGSRAQAVAPKEVRQLRTSLEKLIGNRQQWATPLLRQLFDALWQRARGRRRSVDHERAWLNLVGFCMRPGFGHPLDEWRIEQLWSIFEAGVQHRSDTQLATEWWTMWRRVAGGLDADAQLRLLDDFAFNVQDDSTGLQKATSGAVSGSHDDMLRLVGSLERIPADYKIEIGDWLFGCLDKTVASPKVAGPSQASIAWALARIGARQPFYGSPHCIVPPDTAVAWIERLMTFDWKRLDGAALAAAHLARLTGDRTRDLPVEIRAPLALRLQMGGAPASVVTMIQSTVQLDEASERSFLGDSLPPGLKLLA